MASFKVRKKKDGSTSILAIIRKGGVSMVMKYTHPDEDQLRNVVDTLDNLIALNKHFWVLPRQSHYSCFSGGTVATCLESS